jgi:hypothetical protein
MEMNAPKTDRIGSLALALIALDSDRDQIDAQYRELHDRVESNKSRSLAFLEEAEKIFGADGANLDGMVEAMTLIAARVAETARPEDLAFFYWHVNVCSCRSCLTIRPVCNALFTEDGKRRF